MKLNYFNFKLIDGQVLLTNDLGKYIRLTLDEFRALIFKNIEHGSALKSKLQDSAMIYEGSDLQFSFQHHYELRELKGYMADATSLHIFVVTTACNQNCIYCQANSGTKCPNCFMTREIAEQSVDIALQSPSQYLNFEFQGGEPLLNFDIIRHIIEYAEPRKGDKCIRYNIVSNLTLLTDEIIQFISDYNIGVSTSIDGPASLHNNNRPFKNSEGTFHDVCDAVTRLRDAGIRPGAIQTTTKHSLPYAKEIIKTYQDLGFETVFIRPLTPLGKAKMYWDEIGYTPQEFLTFYKEAIAAVFDLNRQGYFIYEANAAILLKRIHGYTMNYMELRSPCGAGIGQIAYFADGRVFTCDEGRMLAEMGDDSFCIGNVFEDSYQNMMKHGVCRTVCASSTLDSIPSCCDCVYQPYCGTCPVVNYALYNDVIAKSPHTFKCQINEGILDYLFSIILDGKNKDKIILDDWCDNS